MAAAPVERLMTVFSIGMLSILQCGLCGGSNVGVCYGRRGDDLPTPDKVAKLVLSKKIKYLRIYDSNVEVIKAFSRTGVDLMIGIPNLDLLGIAQFQSNADTWLKNTVLPYYPSTKISHVTVGAEVTETHDNTSHLVIPAMENIFEALKKAGLQRRIMVSTTNSLGILSRSFPPSAGAFNSSFAFFLKPLLDFLADKGSPLMINVYPYYAYVDLHNNVSLDYALFQSSSGVIDPNTGVVYTNMFDAQVDAVYFALTGLNFRTIKIMVTETGWPSKGSEKETAATPDNAKTYNTNLIRRAVNGGGTPWKPRVELDVYIFSLFNEDRKPGLDSERNWGLFYPDETSVYSIDLTGKGGGGGERSVGGGNSSDAVVRWCIASSRASTEQLQGGLDWACGSADAECIAIQPSQPCFEPDTLLSHASYAFNSYYQQHGATSVACTFSGASILVFKDPSYEKCMYATVGGSKNMSGFAANGTPPASSSGHDQSELDMWISIIFLTASFFTSPILQ